MTTREPFRVTATPAFTLANPLNRWHLLRLLQNAASSEAMVTELRPLPVVNSREDAQLLSLQSDYGLSDAIYNILARIGLALGNELEYNWLLSILNSLINTLPANGAAIPFDTAAGYYGVVGDFNPPLWYRLDEAASPAINYGSVASVNGTVTDMGAFQAAGPNARIPLAYTFNGTNSLVAAPETAGLQSADYTIAALINPTSAGEVNQGAFFGGRALDSSAATRFAFVSAQGRLLVEPRNIANTAFQTTTAETVPFGVWQWVFAQFNSATALPSAWRSVSGILTEFTYTLHPVVTGTPRQNAGGGVGNVVATTTTFDGSYAQFIYFNRLLTTTEMQSIITASGI